MKRIVQILVLGLTLFLLAPTSKEQSGRCDAGLAAGTFPCSQVDLQAVVDLSNSGIRSSSGNDIWGWTDPETQKEYAIMGFSNKTSFIDITDTQNPVVIGYLKTHSSSSTWRDIKVYNNHAFIVSEARNHGMQVFNLTQLREQSPDEPIAFSADAHYPGFTHAHNIVINEESGFAYAVGTNTCDGGLHIINIQEPLKPRFVTCIDRRIFEPPTMNRGGNKDGESYTHDAQCVNYHGPDERFQGREICVCSNEDSLNVVDVTDKSNPVQIAAKTYRGVRYTHQGWLSEDHAYFFLGDELDESSSGVKTRTFIWNFTKLDDIKLDTYYEAETKAIDHNMYVKGNYLYQANYDAGVRILNIENVSEGKLREVAYFDTVPTSDRARFTGVWSVFPYFKSGTVIASSIDDSKLYILKPRLGKK